jgi:predicted MFS family arabinose efflux permease
VGGMLGISAAFLSAANALAPIIGGALFQTIGPAAPFLFGGLFIGLLFWLTRRRFQADPEQPAANSLSQPASES